MSFFPCSSKTEILSLRLTNKMFKNPLNLLEHWPCICSVLHVLDFKNGGLEGD